ncbi:glycerate kinase [Amycolatopsis sp. NPDC006131]|uniref:glycerate kinase family protein n=1 Tax=Amycolatopsis sp. NPDC006131 TaxID=3156731 RepID=UPI0033A7F280
MRVLIAPDSFKGSATARDAARALADGWVRERPGDELVVLPQADGGEGTAEAIRAATPGAVWRTTPEPVTGPGGAPVPGRWLSLPDGTAVAELATVCGLPMLGTPDPMGATTRGLGEVIRAAVGAGATSVTVALGGSASTDGGAGALRGLGARLLDDTGAELPPGGEALSRLDRIDVSGLVPPPPDGVELLADTTATLTGPHGAAQVFGPQKGASAGQIAVLDAALTRFAEVLGAVLPADPGRAGTGAAGGAGFGLSAWGGELVDGASRIARRTGLSDVIGTCDVVVTGEGRYDHTSGTGKVVGSLLARCAALDLPSIVVAGRLAVPPPGAGVDLTALAGSTEAAIAEPTRFLHTAGAHAARTIPSA